MWTLRWQFLFLAAAVAPWSTAADVPATEMAKGLFRGTMVSFEGSTNAGVLLARKADGVLYGCGYDSKSFFEYEHQKTSVAKLQAGDPLEILTDHKPGSRVCYVRMVTVAPLASLRPARKEEPAPARAAAIAPPHGDRTVSGVVIRLNESSVTLRTRSGEETMLLRRDTVYQSSGLHVDASALSVNEHVSVRAGKNVYGQAEAYQVIWGDIVDAP